MEEERLPKKVMKLAKELESLNLFVETWNIVETNSMIHSDDEVANMTKNQWKKLIEKNWKKLLTRK